MEIGHLFADIFFYLTIMIGFVVGMFVAKDEGVLVEKATFFVVISLFSLPLSLSLFAGTLYYWTAHRVDEVDLDTLVE